ncbi:hypothetical protein BDV38DRAFT_244523 [Aspergillus pseudotamarii]|uniref:Uncharacterized protein n=1 Tax=Aspergillus pseudotamarii TaxID=132259 RepID=A0A5N6SWW6_ASPPS|nr:uncharacterized protein BDV38DRAFT_244523 [Aspergillus pseudotamarii]KAE8138397.1 hypothetical protein BDV38DRAFT_244523 [Aspergillus pseudotamarii]
MFPPPLFYITPTPSSVRLQSSYRLPKTILIRSWKLCGYQQYCTLYVLLLISVRSLSGYGLNCWIDLPKLVSVGRSF